MQTPSLPKLRIPVWRLKTWPIVWAFLAFLILILAVKGKTPDSEWTPFSDQSSLLMATMSLWNGLDLRYTLGMVCKTFGADRQM